MGNDWNRLVGHPLPPDFPFGSLIAIHDIARQRTASPNWEHFAGAENGIAYRAMSVARFSDDFVASVNRRYTPAERAEQEQCLFCFFSAIVSAVDAVYFALYAVGAIFDPVTFDRLPSRPKTIERQVVVTAFDRLAAALAAAEGDAPACELAQAVDGLCASLQRTLDDPTFEGCLAVRNVLSHRAAPGRLLDGTASPMVWKLGAQGISDDAIGTRLTESRREWYMKWVSAILDDALTFLRHWPLCQAEADLAARTGGFGY